MKRLLFLLLGLLIISSAHAVVTLENTTTQYTVTNGLIKVVFTNGDYTNLYYWDNDLGSYQLINRFSLDIDGTYFTSWDSISVTNNSHKATINLIKNSLGLNFTIVDNYFLVSITNTTAYTTRAFLMNYLNNGTNNYQDYYFYVPNVALYTTDITPSGVGLTYDATNSDKGYVVYFNSLINKTVFNTFSKTIDQVYIPNNVAGYERYDVRYTSAKDLYMTVGVLPNINLTTSGDIATDYYWDSWSPKSDAPSDYERYWDFNEGTGTIADDKGSDDADLTLNSVSWVEGKGYWSGSYDGATSYAESTDLTSLSDDTTGTICLWFKNDDLPTGADGLLTLSSGSDTTMLEAFTHNNGNIYAILKVDGVTSFSMAHVNPVTVGEWGFFCIVQDGTTAQMWVNAENLVNASNGDWIDDLVLATTPITKVDIGMIDATTDYYWDGVIDEVRIYDRALTQAEITALYGQGLPDSLNNNYESTNYGYTTNDSFVEIFSNLSFRPINSITDTVMILGTNSNYTSRVFTYDPVITNDFGINPDYYMFVDNDTYYHVPVNYNMTIPTATGSEYFTITPDFTSWNYTTIPYPVIGVNAENCSVGCAEGMRFTFKDEKTLEEVTGHFTASIQYDGGVYGLSAIDERYNQTFDMFPYYGILNYSQIHITYAGVNGVITYGTRDYYLTDNYIDNITDNIVLYQLEELADVTFSIVTQYNTPVINATIQALKYYDDQDAYILVTSSQTDDFGHSVLQLDLGNWYRIIITDGDETYIYKLYITSTSLTIQLNPLEVDTYLNNTLYSYDKISASFQYDNETNLSWLYIIDSSGLVNNATLIVEDISLRDNLGTICNITNFTAGSFYIYCDLTNESYNKVFHAYAVATFSDGFEQVIYNDYFTTYTTSVSYSNGGLIATFFIILLLTFGGVMLGGHAVLLMPLIGLIVSKFANLINISWGSISFYGLIVAVFLSLKGRGE